LALNPDQTMMQVLQASLEADAGRLEDADRRLAGLLAQDLPDRESFNAHKESARVADGLGRYAEVFPHLKSAAEVAGRLPEWRGQDRSLIPRLIAANTGAYTEQDLGRWSGAGLPRPPAVHAFVIGFFRCGTTLTQEVLAAHPDVFVADEATLIWRVQQALHQRDPGPDPIAVKLKRLDPEGVACLRAVYWEAVSGLYGAEAQRPVFVDKYTMNTLDLGLINTLFPDARIIFANRNPRDVCLSAHMQLMRPSPATAGLLTWRGSADLYARTMNWWRHIRERLTMPVLELRYEQVVADFEPTYRRVFEFLDLPWNPAAANFHTRAQGRFVASPSRNQVARPLYSSSVARWRRYEDEFTKVTDLLDPLVASLGYSA